MFLEFQSTRADFLESFTGHSYCGDYLEMNIPGVDFVFMNPPYASAEKRDDYWSADARDLYAYFMERAATTSRGFISITPQSFTNAGKFHGLRTLLADTCPDIDMYVFDNVPDTIFKGLKYGSDNTNKANSVRAAITIAGANTGTGHRCTQMLRWKTAERHLLWGKAPEMLAPTTIKSEFIPKNAPGLERLLEEAMNGDQFEPLESLTVGHETEHSLLVPTTPRYYITASKRHINRTSFQMLYFENETNLNRTYLALNSGLAYWWWRVRDGGMQLSAECLNTMPIPRDLCTPQEIIEPLEESEAKSLVIKMNAGKPIENIKHPAEVICAVDRAVLVGLPANIMAGMRLPSIF